MPSTLSTRGQALVDAPLRPDFDLFHEADADRYDPRDNPGGAVPLCIAENVLAWPRVSARLRELAGEEAPAWVGQYTDVRGAPDFREAFADFASRHLTTLGGRAPVVLDPDGTCVSSGATAVVELTAMLLGDDGDVAAFPAPCYPVYAKDVGHKAHLDRYDIQCRGDWVPTGTGTHDLCTSDLDRTHAELRAEGRRLRVLVLTQPDNPTGAIYPTPHIEAVADWCEAREVHLCVNELYALSQLDCDDRRIADDYADLLPAYHSFLRLIEARRSPYLHWWYSFSKDFGVSGLRTGVLYSRNADLVAAFGNLGAPHTVSNHTQWLLSRLIADGHWVAAFAKTNCLALTDAYARVATALREAGYPYRPARGSLFVWVDFTRHPLYDGDDEAFWRRVYDEHRVLLTHPAGFGQAERGWFRIVYTCVEAPAIDEALRRICAGGPPS